MPKPTVVTDVLEWVADLKKYKQSVSGLNAADILLNLLLVGGFSFLAVASWRGGGALQQVKLIWL